MSTLVQEVTWQQAERDLIQVREKVFVCEHRFPWQHEFDDVEERAKHMLLVENGQAIGVARLSPDGLLSRLGVLVEKRTPDRVKLLLELAADLAKQMGLSQVFINCPLEQAERLKRDGLEPVSLVFMEQGVPWQTLVCPIPKLPQMYVDTLH